MSLTLGLQLRLMLGLQLRLVLGLQLRLMLGLQLRLMLGLQLRLIECRGTRHACGALVKVWDCRSRSCPGLSRRTLAQ